MSSPTTERPACPPGDDFDPFDGEPQAFLAGARAERPVFYHSGLDAYVLTRYADCHRVHSDTENVSAQPALLSHLNVEPMPEAMRILGESGFVPAPSIVDEDGTEHRLHRGVAHPPFRIGRITLLEPFIRRQVTERLDAIAAESGEVDIVDALIYEVPATVILHMMGIPDEQMGMVKGFRGPWAVFIWGNPDEEVQLTTARMMGVFGQWARGIAAAEVENPSDGIIGETVKLLREKGELESSRLWLDSYTLNVVMAGHETTTNTMAGGLVALLEHPDQWRAVCADPSLIPNAVEEILRYATGVPAWRKRVLVDMDFSGVTVPSGSLVYTALNSANRDEDVFPDGETFDIRRANANRHLAFGGGVHTCMGNHLAKLEMRIMLEELTRRFPNLALVAGRKLHYSPNTTQRGPESVFVRW